MSAELESVIRSAANIWLEQTETDREVLRELQRGTIAECARYLRGLGLRGAAAELERMK